MRPPKERLSRLLELAAQGGAARATLAHELSDILLDWPAEYTEGARLPFEALLEKTIREVDRKTRISVAARFAKRPDAPIDLMNELFFSATAELKSEIVARNAGGFCHDDAGPEFDEHRLLDAMRASRGRLAEPLARALCVLPEMAEEILGDISGQSLAIACKGAHAARATFSAIAVLSDRTRAAEDSYLRLATYDEVPQSAAERILASWRAQTDNAQMLRDAAAE
jgi:hypothetical protein